MANFTCSHCFKATEYKFDKPKFCASCGRNVIDGFRVEASQPPPRRPASRQSQYEDNYEDDYYEEPVRHRRPLRKIEAKITGINSNRGLKLIDAAQAGGEIRNPSTENQDDALRDFYQSDASIYHDNDIPG